LNVIPKNQLWVLAFVVAIIGIYFVNQAGESIGTGISWAFAFIGVAVGIALVILVL
jgi:hypothetical protein